jgi:2-dehydro-3-deoxyphosphogluconate aldolase/(4S)-4-hydroxy-2-oxoglutarate aldolase
MDKNEILNKIKELGLLAVIRGPSPDLTIKMVAALVAGGVTGIEITFSTPNAPQVVETLAQDFGDRILLGMGTLTEVEHADLAAHAGASFLVSPHCEKNLAEAMLATGLPVMLGALTPSEVIQAYRFGSDVVKIFPGSLVGPGYIKALRGPYPYIPMMPTGGVSVENVAEWFAAGVFAVGAGSNLCPTAWAKEGRFDDISQTARAYVEAVQRAKTKSKSAARMM